MPPGVVTPLYAFEPLSESKDRLWLHVRLATAHGQWSPAISLADEERSFFFTESSVTLTLTLTLTLTITLTLTRTLT